MKKICVLFMAVAALIAVATSCNKDTPEEIIDESGVIDLTVSGILGEYQPDGAKSSIVSNIRVTWDNGDKVLVFDQKSQKYLGDLTASITGSDTREAKLSGTINAPEGSVLVFVHGTDLNPAEYTKGIVYTSITVSLANQGETTPFLVYGTANYSKTNISDMVVNFDFATSVISTYITGLPVSSVISSVSISDINTKCSISISDVAVGGNTSGTITKIAGLGKSNDKGQTLVNIAVPKSMRAARNAVVNVIGIPCYCGFFNATLESGYVYNTIIDIESEGPLVGEFSVSDTKKVRFAKGNLQASVNASGIPLAWRFATNQYDYIGSGGANIKVCTAAGDIDLFGWSTSKTTFGISNLHLKEDYSGQFVDWGEIMGADWRTLSKDEWTYLLKTRPNADNKIGYAKVCDKYGVIILPDNFVDPMRNENENGVEGFIPLTTTYTWELTEANVYSAGDSWDAMAAAGAVFLPESGYRAIHSAPTQEYHYGSCRYWTSSSFNSEYSYAISCIFSTIPDFFGLYISDDLNRSYGLAVRLVTDVE